MITFGPALPVGEPASRRRFPYVVVRLMSAVYQREDIDVQVGESAVNVGFRNSFVRHPQPFTEGGEISAACRELLVAGVIAAVRRTGFRMCLVWREDACTYCEKDGIVSDSGDPPSGGAGSGGVGGTSLPGDVQFEKRLPLEKADE